MIDDFKEQKAIMDKVISLCTKAAELSDKLEKHSILLDKHKRKLARIRKLATINKQEV